MLNEAPFLVVVRLNMSGGILFSLRGVELVSLPYVERFALGSVLNTVGVTICCYERVSLRGWKITALSFAKHFPGFIHLHWMF